MRLSVHIIEARNLIAQDSNGFSDPFVMLQLGNQKFRTKVIDMNLNPTWDEKFYFELRDVRDALRLVVYDKDLIGMDFLGKVKFPISDLLNTENFSYGTQWYKLQPENDKCKNKERGEIHVTIAIERGEVRHSFAEPIPVADTPKKANAEPSSLSCDMTSDMDSALSKQDSNSTPISEAANDTEVKAHSQYSSNTDNAEHRGDNYKKEAEQLENSLKEEREVLKAAETKIAQLEEELKNLRLENKKSRDEFAESSSQHVQKFLGSNSFKKASLYAVQELLQAFIYKMLKDLGDDYPFIPEQLGYGPVHPDLQVVKDLSNFKWDEITDEMQGSNGEEFPKSGKLQNVKPTGLVYTWKSMGYEWPADVTVAPPTKSSKSEDEKEETKRHLSPQEEEIEKHPSQEQQSSESEIEEEETEKRLSLPQEEEIEMHSGPLQGHESSESEDEYEEAETHMQEQQSSESENEDEETEKQPNPLLKQQSSEFEDEEETKKQPSPLQEQLNSEFEDKKETEKHLSPLQEQQSSELEDKEETEKHPGPPQEQQGIPSKNEITGNDGNNEGDELK